MIIYKQICILGVLLALFAGCAETHTPLVERHRALLAQQNGDLEESIQIRKDLIRQFPLYRFLPDIHFNQGQAYVELGQDEKAIESFSAAIELDPGFRDAFVNRSNLNYRLGNYQQAISDSDQSIVLAADTDFDQADVYLMRGDAYDQMGDTIRAIHNWEFAIVVTADAIVPRLRIAEVHFDNGQFDQALGLIDEVLTHEKQNPELYLQRCQVLAKMNRIKEAQTSLEKARELDTEGELKIPETVEKLIVENLQGLNDQNVEQKNQQQDHITTMSTVNAEVVQKMEFEQAIKIAREFLTGQGIECFDGPNDSTDRILCKEQGLEFQVLVKMMSQQSSRSFELTVEQYELVNSQPTPVGLLLVADIEFNSETGTIEQNSGRIAAFAKHWKPEPSRLKPTAYYYQLPEKP